MASTSTEQGQPATSPPADDSVEMLDIDKILSVPDQKLHLDGKDYLAWRFRIEQRLNNAELWGHVDPNAPVQIAPARTWLRRDNKVKDYLFRHLSNDLVVETSTCHTAAEVWTWLSDQYASKDITDKAKLLHEWCNLKLKRGESPHQFTRRVRQLAQKRLMVGSTVT